VQYSVIMYNALTFA